MKVKELGIWALVIGALIGGLLILINLVNSSPSRSDPVKIANLPQVSKEDISIGTGSAKVTLIEYADFECPGCASYYPLVKQLEVDFPNDLRIVYRFFPLNFHKNAMIAAQAGYAAHLQGKFWEMHDKLFENQKSWEAISNPNSDPKDTFFEYAKDLGLDLAKFKEDAQSDAAKNYIKKETNKAAAIGIDSTPTFILNGVRIKNPANYEAFKKIIKDEINKE